MMKPSFWRVAAAALMPVVSHASATPDPVMRGWQPPSALVGEPAPRDAVRSMRELVSLQRMVLNHTELDADTDRFTNELWSTIERFDLKTLYRMLPDKNGDTHSFSVHGGVQEGRYSLRAGAPVFRGGRHDPRQFGEVALMVSSRDMKQETSRYRLESRLGLGMGPVDADTLAAAAHKTLQLMVDGDQFMHSSQGWNKQEFERRAHAMNPALGDEDVAVIAPLWAAFPAMWDLLARTGRVDDVVAGGARSNGERDLTFVFSVDPERMKQHYPALAAHLGRLGSVTRLDMRGHNDEGELLHVLIDSETLKLSVNARVRDGFLVAVREDGSSGKVFSTMFTQPWHLEWSGEGRSRILGIETAMKGLHADMDFVPGTSGVSLSTRIHQVPQVAVSGRALGFMPTGLIDAFLPTNIDELMREFMTVACEGNEGQGIVSRLEVAEGGRGQGNSLKLSSSMEALDNFFVSFGMGIVNDRLIPDPRVSLEIRQFLFDTQEAFSQDLDSFASVAVR